MEKEKVAGSKEERHFVDTVSTKHGKAMMLLSHNSDLQPWSQRPLIDQRVMFFVDAKSHTLLIATRHSPKWRLHSHPALPEVKSSGSILQGERRSLSKLCWRVWRWRSCISVALLISRKLPRQRHGRRGDNYEVEMTSCYGSACEQ